MLVLKDYKEPFIWGKQSEQHIKENLKARDMHRRLPERNQWIIQRLRSIEQWEQVSLLTNRGNCSNHRDHAKNIPISYNE